MDNHKNSEQFEPWLYDDDWENGKIHSKAKGVFYILLVFALFWNAISFPATYFAIIDIYNSWQIDRIDPVLFILIFPIVGLGLLYFAFSAYRQWSAFGTLSLMLDPYPGSIGGEVAGYVDIPVIWRSGYKIKVVLNNVHYTISRSAPERNRRQNIIWSKHCAVEYQPCAAGIRILFKCPIDGGQESEKESGNSYYRWEVNIQAEHDHSKLKLDREFDIPVYKLDPPQFSRLNIHARLPEMETENIDEQQVKITQHTRSLELFFPRTRYRSMPFGVFLVGLIFMGITGFLGYATWSDIQHTIEGFSILAAGMSCFMTLIFALVSIVIIGNGFHLMSNDLTTKIDSTGIMVNSRSWLNSSEKKCALEDIKKISKTNNMSNGQGNQSVIYFTISAELKKHPPLVIGDGIKGQLAADALIKLINKQTEVS